jgi:4-hydroxythreonine-4-phosphate dehydrogenase
MKKLKRIIVTAGEPAGIGPDITIQIAQQSWDAELIVMASPDLLMQRAQQLQQPLELITADLNAPISQHQPGQLKIIPVPLDHVVIPGKLNTKTADYVLNCLSQAADYCLKKYADALVTGPVHKEIINQAGIAFTGHTEFFAQYCGVAHTVMLFVVDQLKVALATTHLALKDVPQAITKQKLQLTLTILNAELKKYFNQTPPKIYICGLNPHAGEGGYLGKEEIEVITPLIDELNQQGFHLTGPLSADTIFTAPFLAQADAILAMYHDQALPIVKYIGFGHAVNVTLGLPFIRTSVDHGTALDIAATGRADASSMQAAVELAIKMASTRKTPPIQEKGAFDIKQL